MIVRNFHAISVFIVPLKADTPLVVDANTVLPGAVAAQFFQPVGRRHTQICQRQGIVEHPQLSQRDLLDFRRQFARTFEPENLAGLFVMEGFDHDPIL